MLHFDFIFSESFPSNTTLACSNACWSGSISSACCRFVTFSLSIPFTRVLGLIEHHERVPHVPPLQLCLIRPALRGVGAAIGL